MAYTPEQVEALSQAMWQLLDDMRADGHCVCGFAKAQARVAYEPFRIAESERDGEEVVCDMPLEVAQRIVEDCTS